MNFIEGSSAIIKDYGYWPTFHDDYITNITIDASSVDIIIMMDKKPEEYDDYYILLTFEDVIEFEVKGELSGSLCIILDMTFCEGDSLMCNINSSLGVCGYIKARRIKIKKLIVKIDLSEVTNSQELHMLLSEKLCFPKLYGMNWDAFWDTITGLVSMPRTIVFLGWKEFQYKNIKDSEMLLTILNKYKENNSGNFKVICE